MAHWKPVDQVQDLVNKMGGDEGISKFLCGQLKLVPRDPSDLFRPVGEPVVMDAVTRFVAEDAFTKANGIASLGENFKQVMLPKVEEGVASVALSVSELTRSAKYFRAASALNVDERGEVTLAHFFRVLHDRPASILTTGWVAAYVIGNNVDTWGVGAYLYNDGWHVYAYPMGDCGHWLAGAWFLHL